ncbi:MAG: NMD3-related protein [Candidatus Altiarchaeia archaeon]
MICHSCGKKTMQIGLCLDCFLKKHPIIIEDIAVRVCRCGRFWRKALWEQDLEKFLGKMIAENLVADPEIKITEIIVDPVFEEKKIKTKVTLKGVYRGREFSKELSKEIRKETVSCPLCSRVSSSYYEAVVQFRIPVNAKKVLDGEYVTRTEKVAGGFDAYLTSAHYARKLGTQFARKGYIVMRSKQIAGMKDGVEMCREFVAIKSPGVEVGDFITQKDKILQIMEFGRTIRTRDVAQRKTQMIPPNRIEKAEVVARKGDVKQAMVSSISPATMQFMDQESFSTFELPNKYPELKEKDIVIYVKIGTDLYIL